MAYDGYPQGYAANLRQELESAEAVLWEGRPVKRGFRLRLGPQSCVGMPFLAFSLFWTGMALYMTRQIPSTGSDGVEGAMRYIFPLFGVPFILVGLGLCFGPSILATASLKNAEYLLTDRRVLVRGGAGTATITHAPLADVTSVTSSGGAVGSVTLAFPNGEKTLVFDSIPNPSQVRVLVEDAVRRAKEMRGK